jgi:hypothetical protein
MIGRDAKEYLINMSYKLGNMSIEYLTEKDGEKMREAIRILEQEPDPVLDKIRAETEELDGIYVIGDLGIDGENIPMDDLFYSHKYVRLCDVLQIIDRYNAEFDGIGDE